MFILSKSRSWYSRRYGASTVFRITAQFILAASWGLALFLWRWVNYKAFAQGGRAEIFLLCIWLALVGVSGIFFLFNMIASEDLGSRERNFRTKLRVAQEIRNQAEKDMRSKVQIVELISELVEQKADHKLLQLRFKRKNPAAFKMTFYDPLKQIRTLNQMAGLFFAELLKEKTAIEDAQVFATYFAREGEYMLCKFCYASRDPTWDILKFVNEDHREDFKLSSPARTALVYAAHSRNIEMYMIPDCVKAHADPDHTFRYFEQAKEEPENKSMMIYVVRDKKDHDTVKGVFCIHTNLKGFFDSKNESLKVICEDFMKEIRQRTILEVRQFELTGS